MKQNGNKKLSFIDKILKHKPLIVFLLGIIYWFLIFCTYFYRQYLGATLVTGEKIYYTSQIVVGFFTCISVVVAALQYVSNSKFEQKERNREKIKEAVRIAEKFSSEIIPESKKLTLLYNTDEGKAFLSKINHSTLKNFDTAELTSLFQMNLNLILKEWFAIMYKGYRKNINPDEDSNTSQQSFEEYMKQLYVNLSNEMEAICICINSGIADDVTLYQSIHGVYFNIIEKLYVYMSKGNNNESDRIYSNVRKLYIQWQEKYNTIKKAEQKTKMEIEQIQSEIMKNFLVENIDE